MTHARAVLACCFALVLGLALSAGGCANGGDSSAAGDDDSSIPSGDDGATNDVSTSDTSSGCAAPKTQCGSTCTSTTNDPKNCGQCGVVCGKDEVCSGGSCSFSCASPETLCNAPSEGGTAEAGGDASGTKSDAATDGAAKDAAGSDGAAADASGGDGAAGDGGATGPYCANLGTDNYNCGTCGHVCLGQHTCNNGTCGLTCGPGQKACIAGDVCITTGTCCSSADCQVTGQICPQPGGACQCPGGETVCSKTNSCISSSNCCTDADCAAVAGATCPTPGQACQCSGGQKACISTKSCIPQTACCTAAGQCCADPLGKSCPGATAQAALGLGQTIAVQGLSTASGEEDWIKVTFNSTTNVAFHARVHFTANPNNEFVFDVASDCKSSIPACGEGGICQGKTDWEVSYSGPNPPADPNSPGFQPIPAIGDMYIRVYRGAGGAPTCDQWALAISE